MSFCVVRVESERRDLRIAVIRRSMVREVLMQTGYLKGLLVVACARVHVQARSSFLALTANVL